MTKTLVWICRLSTALLFLACQDSARAESMETRAQTILANVAAKNVNFLGSENGFKTTHFEAQARFAVGDDEKAREIIDQALRVKPIVEYYDPECPLWSTMDCYMRWKDVPGKYTAELKERTRDYIAAAKIPSDATTYNHHWMLAAGLMLAYLLMKADGGFPFTWQRPAGTLKLELQQAGFVVETVRPGDYDRETPAGQLAAFQRATGAAFDRATLTATGTGTTIDYANLAGARMQLEWRDEGESSVRCVDGEPVEIDDPRGWPLIENPWVGQAYCGPTLTLVHGDQMVVYDFRQRTVTTTKSR